MAKPHNTDKVFQLAINAAPEKYEDMPSWLSDTRRYVRAKLVGSHFFNTHLTEDSDYDIVVIVVPPECHVYPSDSIYVFDDQPKVFEKYFMHNITDECDLTFLSLPYFMRELVRGTPNMLELAVTEYEHDICGSPVRNMLTASDYFSKEAAKKMCYGAVQATKLARKVFERNGELDTERSPYKTLSHASRLLDQATSMVEYGDIELRCNELTNLIKREQVCLEDTALMLSNKALSVIDLINDSDLPARADKEHAKQRLKYMLDSIYEALRHAKR